MDIYLGADHRGFALKETIKAWLTSQGIQVHDLGAESYDKTDDYVSYAYSVATHVAAAEKQGIRSRGIVLCGSGVGVEMVADKVSGIRCGLGFSQAQVSAARHDDAITILALPADYLDIMTAKKLVKVFLETPFSQEERHKRRIRKINELDYYL